MSTQLSLFPDMNKFILVEIPFKETRREWAYVNQFDLDVSGLPLDEFVRRFWAGTRYADLLDFSKVEIVDDRTPNN